MNLPSHLNRVERDALEQAIRELATKYQDQVRFVALFGSKARGDFGPESDIDLLIISEADDWRTRDEIRTPVADANIDHGVYLSARVISWVRFQTLHLRRPGLFADLCRDAIELWRRPGTENPLKTPELALAA
ncbi:MAG: nucleotidyltransferase domain-containing protein [Chloroflexi bacterium]|nr:nucleotidyltransferase domain-containing protein [Chloroflexota bacterium]